MRLTSFTVRNFRSITTSRKVELDQATVLVGQNNEGKSNLLMALSIALQALLRMRDHRRRRVMLQSPHRQPNIVGSHEIYERRRDFPVQLDRANLRLTTQITLDFFLDQEDIAAFKSLTGSSLNSSLPINFVFRRSRCEITVKKQGPSKKTLTEQAAEIATFISDRLDFEYIPAVRTAEQAQDIVAGLVSKELATLETSPAYSAAIQKIADLQKPILQKLSSSLESTLRDFLPSIDHVEVRVAESARYRALRRCEVLIDDGHRTELSAKGDGVQSLAALGVMRHASATRSAGKHLIIAIEEPESHLHPRAQHELRAVINELAQDHQIVITTHCPLFVDRSLQGRNVIVEQNRSYVARTIAEIRDLLGVRPADNLMNAEVVVIVEGGTDALVLSHLTSLMSDTLKHALHEGVIVFISMGGAGKLSYLCRLYRSQICRIRVFLDDDQSGRMGYSDAKGEGLLGATDVHFTKVAGKEESELEDLFDPAFVSTVLQESYGVKYARLQKFKKKKWSAGVQLFFEQAGKPWDDELKEEVKVAVARASTQVGLDAFDNARLGPIKSFVASLENDVRKR